MPKTTEYVLGFLFDPGMSRIALIKKTRPEWMKGRFNALGGHVKSVELHTDALVREIKEESGITTTPEQWMGFAQLRGDGYTVGCAYTSVPNIMDAQGWDAEGEVVRVMNVYHMRDWPLMPDIQWLTFAAISHHQHPNNFIKSTRTAPFHLNLGTHQ